MRHLVRVLLTALVLASVPLAPAAAVEPADFMRPCKRQDLIGVWRVLRLGLPTGADVDRTDPAYLPHQRYVFHSNATMVYVSQEVAFTPEEQRALTKLPVSATWALESDGRLVRQREGVAAVEKADCRVMIRAVKDPKTSQPTAQAGDLLLTDERADNRPAARRLLRKIGS
jgi:hypothetical protein